MSGWSKRKNTAEDQLRKLHGIKPYNEPSNYLIGDPYFAKSIVNNFSESEIDSAKKRLGLK